MSRKTGTILIIDDSTEEGKKEYQKLSIDDNYIEWFEYAN